VGTAGSLADNFDSSSNYDWIIATGGSIANFAAKRICHQQFAIPEQSGQRKFLPARRRQFACPVVHQHLAPVTPVAINLTPSGGDLVFSGSNGVPFRPYYVLVSTNLGLPLANWRWFPRTPLMPAAISASPIRQPGRAADILYSAIAVTGKPDG